MASERASGRASGFVRARREDRPDVESVGTTWPSWVEPTCRVPPDSGHPPLSRWQEFGRYTVVSRLHR